jgi:transposase-like protein
MKQAVEEWKRQYSASTEPRMSIRTIARAWQIPYETLRRRIYGKVEGYASASGRPTVLHETDETELVTTVKNLSAVGFPLARKDIQRLAFSYAKAKGYKGFSDKRDAAGYYWFHGFLSRHPDISVKKAENLSVARAMGMNKPQVFKWFELYENLLSRLGVRDLPRHVWNLDETGVQNIHKADEVVAAVGRPSYNITAVEKGDTSTVLAALNAFGDILPPMVIHKGKVVGKGWKDGAPFGTLVKASDNGWINKELFLEFGELFVKFIQSDANLNNGLPHVLVMDNHYSHVFNMEFLSLMKANNIHVFALPSHTTHWLQPLDRVPSGSFKRHWNEEMRLFTRNNAGRKLEKKEFFKIFTPVWQRSMNVELAQAGFRATGLFPVNIRAVPDNAYEPSTVTERRIGDTDSLSRGRLTY